MYRSYRSREPSGGGGGALLFLVLIMLPVIAYFVYKNYKGAPVFEYKVVDGMPKLIKVESSDCSGTEYVKKKECHNKQTGELLNGTAGKCGDGVEEWILNPNAPGYKAAVGEGKCESDFRPCNVLCDEPCKGDSWIEGPCMRDGVVLDGSEADKCGLGMRTYTLNEKAPDYKAALGKGKCTKNYQSACTVECPANAVAPPACVYSSNWQRSANGCVVSKEDRAKPVGYDQKGWQEYFKLALQAENCTGEKRLSEWETCTGPPGPVNCQGTWGPNDGWGPCTGSCDTQPSQSRKYSVIKEAAHGGSQCPYSNGETQTRNCGTIVPCPVDCKGYYTDPACPTECGRPASTIKKDWIITKAPVGTGAACPAPSTKSCPATAPCPSACEGRYTDPACPTECGRPASTVTKQWVTTKAPVGTGAACPAPSTKSCPATAPCPSACEGRYTDPACPTDCGRAASTVTKQWVTTKAPVGTGAACPAPSTKSCPATGSCPWVKSGYCGADGKQRYTRNVVNNGDATSKTENCCFEGNAWQNYMCNPNNSMVQRKKLVNCALPYVERTVPNGCSYKKCTVQTWKHSDFRDHTWIISDTLPNVSSTGSRHDEISSYAKYGNCKATAYEHPNYGGWGYELQEGRHNVPGWVNDRISSIKIEHLPYKV